MLRLIDSTPIPTRGGRALGEWNGRTRGLKLHVVWNPTADHPRRIEITPSTVNDVQVVKAVLIEAGASYVFDKAYCHYAWWTRVHGPAAPSSRAAKPTPPERRPLARAQEKGRRLLRSSTTPTSNSQPRAGHTKLATSMRRVRVKREDGAQSSPPSQRSHPLGRRIAALYKARWQIELLFRWIKQHLRLRTFLGRSPQNADSVSS